MTKYLIKWTYISGPNAGKHYIYGKGDNLISEEAIPLRINDLGYVRESTAKGVCTKKKKAYAQYLQRCQEPLSCEDDVEIIPFAIEV